MVRILEMIFEAFEKAGKTISVCGEMAGNPAAAVLLAGLGARNLSMSFANIAAVKAALAKVNPEDAKALVKKCKYARTEAEIKELINMSQS